MWQEWWTILSREGAWNLREFCICYKDDMRWCTTQENSQVPGEDFPWESRFQENIAWDSEFCIVGHSALRLAPYAFYIQIGKNYQVCGSREHILAKCVIFPTAWYHTLGWYLYVTILCSMWQIKVVWCWLPNGILKLFLSMQSISVMQCKSNVWKSLGTTN